MDPLSVSLVHQYLRTNNPALAEDFKATYKPKKISVDLKEVLSNWDENQLARGVVYKHLEKVAPPLAYEFSCGRIILKDVPEELIVLIKQGFLSLLQEKTILELKDAEVVPAKDVVHQHLQKVAPSLASGVLAKKAKALTKCRHFSKEEVLRIEKAIAQKENIGALAKEMGRSDSSVSNKIIALRRTGNFKKGKWQVDENERMKEALRDGEDYKVVAKELQRDPRVVFNKLLSMKSNPNWERTVKVNRGFSLEEDLLILESVIPHLKFQELSSRKCLSRADAIELSKELQRTYTVVTLHWENCIQHWLLQHFTGTTGLRIEKMVTSIVAQKYKDHQGIDWSELQRQHKEFAGHTSTSLSKVFKGCLGFAKKLKKREEVSLLEVAESAEVFKVKMESVAKTIRREKIISYFEKRVEELRINIVV